MANDSSNSAPPISDGGDLLKEAYLELPYIPDFLLDEVRFYFVPSRDGVRAVYHELVGDSAKNWSPYYTKKGWNFLHRQACSTCGPARARLAAALALSIVCEVLQHAFRQVRSRSAGWTTTAVASTCGGPEETRSL